jgi:hypothetical protein
MYDLQKGISFDFLMDRQLDLLCFGPYTASFRFTDGIQLQVESSFKHILAEQDAEPFTSSFPLSESRLMRLLVKRVTKVSAKHDGTLTLGFENGDTLVIEGNTGPCESYQTARPGCALIVV